jgi:hypothetical protein
MAVVKIDANNPNNFTGKQIVDKGTYVFEIANDLQIVKSKSSDNNIIKVELRVQDEGKFRGAVVYDNIALTPKSEFKLVHLAMAAGTQTKDEIKNDGIDLSLFKGATLQAEVDVEAPMQAPDGTMYQEKNRVTRYIFDATE